MNTPFTALCECSKPVACDLRGRDGELLSGTEMFKEFLKLGEKQLFYVERVDRGETIRDKFEWTPSKPQIVDGFWNGSKAFYGAGRVKKCQEPDYGFAYYWMFTLADERFTLLVAKRGEPFQPGRAQDILAVHRTL